MDIVEIINRISTIRTRANLSARELSLRIGKSESYINRLEYRKNFEPSVTVINEIAEVCDSCLAELFHYDISQFKADKEILELLKTASARKKQAIIDLLKS